MQQYIDIQTFLLFLVVLLIVYLYWTTRLPKNFPPGPRRVPVFGNMIPFGRNPGKTHLVLKGLFKRYGPVVGLKFGSYPTIIISGLETIREAFVKQADVFSNRPSWMFFPTKIYSVNGRIHGLLFNNGEQLKNIRRLTLMSLRDFGVGKNSIEWKIQKEGEFLNMELQKLVGQPVDIAMFVQEAVSNIICSICFGSRFEYDDPEFLSLMQMVKEQLSSALFTSPVNFIPLLQLTPSQGGLREACKRMDKMRAFIRKKIDEHRETFNPDEVRDFIDLYLKYELKGDCDTGFSVLDIEITIVSLFAAGTDTTSNSLRWLLLYMMHFPNVQKKCHEEIKMVIGSYRRPLWSDGANMPFTMAIIQEMQRLANTAPLALPHSVKESTTLCGYSIPKDTVVMASLQSVHMDSNYWDNPEKFRPERWIGPDGKLEKKEAFMPFSVGPRMCLGYMLAKYELFIFLSSLMQKFTFKMADTRHPPSLEGHLGVTLAPAPYKVVISQR